MKTKSTIFLQDLLKERYEVDSCPLTVSGNDSVPDLSRVKQKHYDVVVFFQLMPSLREFKKHISFDRGVLFPMADYYYQQCPVSKPRWKEYKGFKIINFSRAVHEELSTHGFSSHYIQFFPKPKDDIQLGEIDSLFFWQRVNSISFKTIEVLFNFWDLKSVNFHKVIDPGHSFIPPSGSYNDITTYSEWFDTREEMQRVIEQSAIYMAARPQEGIGMSFLEAMAMGKCVVASDDTTMNEYIVHGENGLLYDYKRPVPLKPCDIRRIQKNTIRYIKNGYLKWEKEKWKILDWIEQPVSKNISLKYHAELLIESSKMQVINILKFFIQGKLRSQLKRLKRNMTTTLPGNQVQPDKSNYILQSARPSFYESGKPHVLFDIQVLIDGQNDLKTRTGIYCVGINILKKFIEDDRIALTCFYNGDVILEKNTLQALYSEVGYIGETYSGMAQTNILFNQLASVDIFFSPLFRIPENIQDFPQISKFTILYDTVVLDFPEFFKNSPQYYYEHLINSINQQDTYFAVSESARQDFIRNSFANNDNIIVTHLAASENFYKNKDQDINQLVRQKYNIPQDARYALTLSSLEPRKNLIRTIKAFILFQKRKADDKFVLVCSGNPWNGFFSTLERECQEIDEYKDLILFTGYIDSEDLSSLYSNADFFVYCSIYEGFGLPPLEAMKCGTPVICSNASSLPEVVGNSAIMVDPYSIEDIFNAIVSLYEDNALRYKLSILGLERSRNFSWEKTSDIMIDSFIDKSIKRTIEISVITVVRNLIAENREETFRKSFESVHCQVGVGFEHIIYDGNSNDGTQEMIEKLIAGKENIKFVSRPDNGIYDAMNKAALLAQGKYLVFLNSDDYWHDSHGLVDSYNALENYNADFSYAPARFISQSGKYIGTLYPLIGSFICIMPFCHQTMLTRRELFIEMGMYDLSFKSSGDYDLVLRLILAGKKGVAVDRNFTTYRLGGISDFQQADAEEELRLSLRKNLFPISKIDSPEYYFDIFKGTIHKNIINFILKSISTEFQHQFLNNIKMSERTDIVRIKYFKNFEYSVFSKTVRTSKQILFMFFPSQLKTKIKHFIKKTTPQRYYKKIKSIFYYY